MQLGPPPIYIPQVVLPAPPEMPFYGQWDFWVSVGTMILATVTAWLAVETRRMRRGADRALDVTQNAMKAQAEDTRNSLGVAERNAEAALRNAMANQEQAADMRRSLEIAKRTADAAMMSAETNQEQINALRRQDRAWISVAPPNVEKLSELADLVSTLGFFYAPLIFTNYGKGIAIITRASARFHTLPKGEALPSEPEYDCPENRKMEGRVLLPPNAPYRPLSPPLSSLDFKPVWRGDRDLWLYGFVDYLDIHNIGYQTRFCFFYAIQGGFSPNRTDFYVSGPNAYNQFI